MLASAAGGALQAPWMCQANEDVYDSICFMLSKSRISCDEPPLAKEEIEACPVDGILDQKQVIAGFPPIHLASGSTRTLLVAPRPALERLSSAACHSAACNRI